VFLGRESDAGTARSGTSYGIARSSVVGGSVAQDFEVALARSVMAFAWVRSRTGSPSVSGSFVLWSLSNGQAVTTKFTASQEWAMTCVAQDVPGQGTSNSPMRLEFYLDTINVDLLIDLANVC
jgi:hypothetical protein